MSVIRCPVCGQSNPDDLVICQHCDSALRATTSELNGVGDIFRPGETPTKKVTSELEHALPAWLRNARKHGNEPEEDGAETEQASTKEDTVPNIQNLVADADSPKKTNPADWLAGLDAEPDDDEDDEEVPNWLAGLQSDITQTTETPMQEETEDIHPGVSAIDEPITANTRPELMPDEPPTGTGELPGWLETLQSQADDDAVIDQPANMPSLFDPKTPTLPKTSINQILGDDGDKLPDWLDKLATESAISDTEISKPLVQKSAPTSSADEVPDWLSSGDIPTEAPSVPTDIEATPAKADKAPPDWLSDLQASEEAESSSVAAAPEELPDWLAEGTPSETPDSVATAANDDTPDWLGNLSASTKAESSPAAAIEELPDWLAGEASGETPDSVATAADDDTPDWLGKIPASTKAESNSPTFESQASELPSWISDDASSEEIPEAIPAVEPIAESVTDGGSPDSLSNLPTDMSLTDDETEDEFVADILSEPLADVGESESTQPSAGAFSEISEEIAAAKETPDWLASLVDATGTSLTQEETAVSMPEQPAFIDTDIPVPSDSVTAEDTSALIMDDEIITSADDVDAIFDMEMPDWLSSLGPDDIKTPDSVDETLNETIENTAPDVLSSTELPSWVQAMRPVASVLSDADAAIDNHNEVVENGPLAGLSGVLPAGLGMTNLVKPKSQAIKLNVSETQQTSVALLKRMLAAENEPSPIKSLTQVRSARLLRWLITLLLILAVIPSIFGGTQSTPLASLYPPEVGALANVINTLPSDAPVLLIFDYEPGLSGEMAAAAAPVVDHLMLRGESLVILSTSPTGTALAEHFLQNTQAAHGYQAGEQYLNLGYLPGGSSGILSFAMQPRTAISQEIGSVSIWDMPMLQDTSALTDFAALVVLTDDSETGRAWIEQTGNYRQDTPLLMVVSAQAEPIIQPYYRSGQVDGLVSGLSGGAAYEQLNGRPALGRRYWDAYSIGLLAAEVLIALGVLWSLLGLLRTRNPKEDEV